MPHDSEQRWEEVSREIARQSGLILSVVTEAEEVYQDLVELFQFAGGTDQLLADLLYVASPASAGQVATVTDARAAMSAIHNLYQALDNVAVSASDRFTDLRRMS